MSQTAPTHPNPAPPAANTETPAADGDKLRAAIDAAVVTGWIDQLARFERDVTDAERIDQLRALEQLKSAAAAAAAAQARVRAAHASAIAAGGTGPGWVGAVCVTTSSLVEGMFDAQVCSGDRGDSQL